MLPDVGGMELLVIAAVALIVVGPKDLPVMLRKLGEFMGRIRRMAADFRASFDDMARQTELDDLRKEVEAMRQATQAEIAKGEAAVREEVDILPKEFSFETGFGDEHFAPAETIPEPEPEPAPAKAPRRKAAAKTGAPKTSAKAKAKPIVEEASKRRKPAKGSLA